MVLKATWTRILSSNLQSLVSVKFKVSAAKSRSISNPTTLWRPTKSWDKQTCHIGTAVRHLALLEAVTTSWVSLIGRDRSLSPLTYACRHKPLRQTTSLYNQWWCNHSAEIKDKCMSETIAWCLRGFTWVITPAILQTSTNQRSAGREGISPESSGKLRCTRTEFLRKWWLRRMLSI